MMRCADCLELLDAYLDNELLPEEAGDVRHHLAECPDCTRAFDELAATSRLLREGLARYPAPDMLKARIRSALAESEMPSVSASPEPRRAIMPHRWLRFAAAGLVIAVASSITTYGAVRERGGSRAVRDEVLTSHVRSLMPGHLTDVASNNQHNVKPWFNGRVDLSPPVPGLDSAGFILDGGRLDYVAGRTVAAVVYLRRQHVVNVFSWPEPGDDTQASVVTLQGYHLVSWRTNGVAFWTVSDLNAPELSQFVTLFQHGGADRR
jgi:mycothiol system anti-sigma-R factor